VNHYGDINLIPGIKFKLPKKLDPGGHSELKGERS